MKTQDVKYVDLKAQQEAKVSLWLRTKQSL